MQSFLQDRARLVLALLGASAVAALVGLPVGLFAAPAGAAMFIGETTTTTTMNAALKIIFDDALVNNVVTDSELLSEFPDGAGIQVDQTTGGRFIETAQMFDLPSGVGARSEGDYIPIPRGPILDNSRVDLKKVMGSVEMTAETLKRVRTDEGAFTDWARQALPSLVRRVVNEVDRMTLGAGTGIKARVNDATPATDLVVNDSLGIAGMGGYLLQFLSNETLIASPNADGSSPRVGEMLVTQVDWANDWIEVDALAAALADDDYLFAGDAAGNSAGKEPMGLFGMVDDGGVLATFQNIARATYPAWNAFVLDAQVAPFAAGQTLTEQVVMYADDETFTRGGGVPTLLVTSRQGARQVWSHLVGDRVINDPRDITGGKRNAFILLGDRTVRVRVARKMPPEVAFGLQTDTFKKFVLHNWEWDDTTGSIWRQVTDSTGRKDAFWAYGSMYMELANKDPQKNFRIENLDSSKAFGP